MSKKRGCVIMLALDLLLLCMLLFNRRVDHNMEIMSTKSAKMETENRIVTANSSDVMISHGETQETAIMLADSGEEKAQSSQYIQEKGKIALTFDDGPHPRYTERLLDGLKERNVHVTFFVTGEHAELHPDIILRMQQEGHLIGNHTYSHIQLQTGNWEEFRNELVRTNDIITNITGEEVIFVRPPYGTWKKSLEDELNMFPVLWDVDPLDWCTDDVSVIVERVVSETKEGCIILLHDYYDTSVTAALQIIDQLLERGYEFVTVEEIMFD